MGRRVLLLDNDPQSSLTQGLLGPDAARDLDPSETIYAIYHSGADPREVARPAGLERIDLTRTRTGRRPSEGVNKSAKIYACPTHQVSGQAPTLTLAST
jgi:hypothetical protein